MPRASETPSAAETPDDLAIALAASPAAKARWDWLPPSHKREYLSWITEAKRAETRRTRIAKAITMLVEDAAKAGAAK